VFALTPACGRVSFESTVQTSIETEVGEIQDCSVTAPCDQQSLRPVKQTETIEKTNKVDIVFVVDSSGSMMSERAELGQRIESFIAGLDDIDWQICVTTTDIQTQGQRGLPLTFPDGEKVLNSFSQGAAEQFVNLVTNLPRGSADEQGIHALSLAFKRANSECFREEASLATVLLSDEDERSTGGYLEHQNHRQFQLLNEVNYPERLVESVSQVFGPQKKFIANAIVIRSGDQSCYTKQMQDADVWYGTRYEQLAHLTGGVVGNICAEDYSVQLTSFAKHIKQALDSIQLECVPNIFPKVVTSPISSGFSATLMGNKLYFSSPLPEGTAVSLDYSCSK
jgi:hypothetical protein